MFAAWFNEGFVSEGAQSARLSPLRIGLALVLGALLAWAAGWIAGFAWTATVLILEIPFLALTSAMVPGRPIGRTHAWATFVVYCLTIVAWSAAGALLWGIGRPASDVAAAAFFAGHLMYLQTHHSRSLGALIPATPALIAPLATLLLAPHYAGMDQVLLIVTLGAVVGHGAISIGVSYFGAQQLASANTDLKLAKAEAEDASLAKSAFLATMSHEIRTPLNGVLGMTQAMAAEDALNDAQRQKLEVIRQSGEALLAILNDILDLSKVEAGKLALETIAFDLDDVARGAHQTFTALAKNKGLYFDLAIAPGATGRYRGDPTRLRQILYNLISNALKFTEAGEIRVALAREHGVLRLTVTDTGVGIEPEHLSRLFGKFEQADASTTRRFGGAGLGLSICRELAGLMGGEIEAASRPGEGSAFTVRLPLAYLGEGRAQDAAASDDAGGPATTDFGELRVLAAEDNPVNQLVLKTLLAQIGVEPVMTENGAAALAAWEAQDFDLILMDVQMPVMDGPTAARAIRAAELGKGRPRTRIVALTANAMSHQVTEYAEAGMDGHVAKPIDARCLYEAVAEASAARRASAAAPRPVRARA